MEVFITYLRCWWQGYIGDFMMVTITQIGNQHLKLVTNIDEEIGIPIIESKRYDEIYLYSELWFHLMIKHWVLFYRFNSN